MGATAEPPNKKFSNVSLGKLQIKSYKRLLINNKNNLLIPGIPFWFLLCHLHVDGRNILLRDMAEQVYRELVQSHEGLLAHGTGELGRRDADQGGPEGVHALEMGLQAQGTRQQLHRPKN